MKKWFCILCLLTICFALSAALAETVTIPKAVIAPQSFDQVPEKYLDQFDAEFWGAVDIDGSHTAIVEYNDPPNQTLMYTSLYVKSNAGKPDFSGGRYFFVGNGEAYEYFYYSAYNDTYNFCLYYTMEGELFLEEVWDKSIEVTYYRKKEGTWPINYNFGDNSIEGVIPIDLSMFTAPTIVYEEPLVLFSEAGTEKQGLVYEEGIFKYYENGMVNKEKFGFVSFEGGSFMVANGAVAPVNGLVQDPDHPENWYFCAGGQVQSVTSLVEYDNEWFLVKDGKLDTTVSGYVGYNGGLFYIAAGKLMKQVNGLAQDLVTKEWYFCSQGQVQSEYTGLAMYDGAWFYVQNGKFDPAYNGTITYDGAEFTIVAGQPVL